MNSEFSGIPTDVYAHLQNEKTPSARQGEVFLSKEEDSPENQLPFVYRQTTNRDEAAYVQRRVPIFGNSGTDSYTNEEIIAMVQEKKEAEQWYTQEYWRLKGKPQEQIEFLIQDQRITIYNFNSERPLTDEHLERAQSVFQEMASRFPEAMKQIRWILVDDEQLSSVFDDAEKYPANGMAHKDWNAFQFYPRGTELFPYRLPVTSNFEGVFSHELTHLIEDEFLSEWSENFQWASCSDYEDHWEIRPSPDGKTEAWFHKKTNEMALHGKFPLQPEQCVTDYARQKMNEDICESVVAYIYAPDFLKAIAPEKYAILSKHDKRLEKPEIATKRMSEDAIALPIVKPEVVLYYVNEPEQVVAPE